jgi:hypothetical protein
MMQLQIHQQCKSRPQLWLQTIFKNLYNDKVCDFGDVVHAKMGMLLQF